MMEYKGSYWVMVSAFLRKPMKKWYGDKFTAVVFRRAKPIYREMLDKTEDIGAKNPMASNIYMCYPILAVWKAADGKMSLANYRRVIEEAMDHPLIKKGMACMNIDANDPRGLAKLEDMLHKSADWLKMNPQYADKSWDFNFDKSMHRDGLYYHFTHCPLAEFARENDLLDVLPLCCDIDYITAKACHASLHREQTLATGGTKCDYWYVGDKVENPQ